MSGQGPFQALPMEPIEGPMWTLAEPPEKQCSLLVTEFLLESIRNWSSSMEPCKELLILEALFLSDIWLSWWNHRSLLARWHHPIHIVKGAEESSPHQPCIQAKFLVPLVSFSSVSAIITGTLATLVNDLKSHLIHTWSVLSGPSSTPLITNTVLSWGHHHLLAQTMWITWFLSRHSLQSTCKQPPWTHTCTIRYTKLLHTCKKPILL